MLGRLFKGLFGSDKKSKSLAKSRLHFVLVQDRTGLTNEEMSNFRSEMVEVMQRYFVIDEQGFDIDYQRDGETTTLLINSPVVVKRQEAINGIAGARHNKSSQLKNASPINRSGKASRRKRRNRAKDKSANSGNLTANV